MSGWTTRGVLAFGFAVVLYIGRRALERPSAYPLPPGPSGLPWIGNVLGIDPDAPWLTYTKWAKRYGGIVYSKQLGKDVIIINSEKVAKDLLENRSKIYSDRPYVSTSEMCGLGFNSVLMPYGERWRLHRRFFHQTFRLDAIPRFLPLHHRKACDLLRQLFHAPEQFDSLVFEYAAAVILNSTYDYDPASGKDNLVHVLDSVLKIIILAVRPDVAIIVGALPLLLHVPSWFPGMGFKRRMAVARTYSREYLDRPFDYSMSKPPSKTIAPSMVHDALREMEEKGMVPEDSWMKALKEASGTAFLAASESSHSVVITFILMMMLNPEVQAKAQAQIDAVIGKSRLPTMDDRPQLPLVDAILRETFRIHPVVPLSVPHALMEDDVYEGYHIPKGAIIIANLWAMSRDASRYPNPDVFLPERFIGDDGSLKPNDVEHIAFGFGRRICVGRHFAEASLWAVVAKMLAVFKIMKPLDEQGNEITIEPRYSNGIAVHPLPFKCRIVPRFPEMDAEKLEKMIAASTF